MLSYDNLFCQASLIVSPLILSAIYPYGKKWVYYFSSFLALISVVLIGYVSTWDTVTVIGKKSMYEEGEEEASEESNQVEGKKEPVQVEGSGTPAQTNVSEAPAQTSVSEAPAQTSVSEAPAQTSVSEAPAQVEVEMKEMGNTETIACSVCSIRLVGTKRTNLANCG